LWVSAAASRARSGGVITSYGGAISRDGDSAVANRSPRNGTTNCGRVVATSALFPPRFPVSFREAQQAVDQWIGQYKEGYFPPLSNLARLTEEVGELAREINHRFGQKTKKRGESPGSVAMELADILFVVMCLANSQRIDLDEAFGAMLRKVSVRDAARWTRKER